MHSDARVIYYDVIALAKLIFKFENYNLIRKKLRKSLKLYELLALVLTSI